MLVTFQRRGPRIEGQGPRRISSPAPAPAADIRASLGALREEHARAALQLGELYHCLAGSTERRAERVEGPGITPAAG